MTLTARAWEEDGVWNASIEELPIAVFGASFEQARANLQQALEAHIAAASELGALDDLRKEIARPRRPRAKLQDNVPSWTIPVPRRLLRRHNPSA